MGKIIGWFFSITFFITALGFAKNYSDTGNMTALGVSILCFGFIYWLSKTTYQTTRKVMIATSILMVITGLLTKFLLADLVTSFLAADPESGFYLAWEAAITVLGLPTMIYVFKNDDK